jgi:hypothetical protein
MFLGTGALLTWGLSGFGIPLLGIAMLLATVFWNFIRGILLGITGSLIILIIGFLAANGYMSYNYDLGDYTYNFSSWYTVSLGYILLISIPSVAISYLHHSLIAKVDELNENSTELKNTYEDFKREVQERRKSEEKFKYLSGLLPICASCKKVRDDAGYWKQIEVYIEDHSEAQFSHGLCEECSDHLYSGQEWYDKQKNKRDDEDQ